MYMYSFNHFYLNPLRKWLRSGQVTQKENGKYFQWGEASSLEGVAVG